MSQNTFLFHFAGNAACINRLCITPRELQHRLGEFDQYCPVCLALCQHLVDRSDIAALTHAAEYRGKYYKMCGEDHLEVSEVESAELSMEKVSGPIHLTFHLFPIVCIIEGLRCKYMRSF